MKRLSILAIVALLIMGTVSGTSLAETAEDQVMVLSLNEAIDYALEHNPDIKLAKVSVDEAEKAYNQALDKKEDTEELDDLSDEQLDLLRGMVPTGLDAEKLKELYPAQAKRYNEMAKASLDFTQRATSLSVESAYYNVLSAEKKVTVNQATVDRAAEQLKSAQASFNAGMVAKNDVLGAEVQLDKAKVDLNTAENDLDIAYMQLNRAMGLELDQPLQLTTKLGYTQYDEMELADTVDQAAAMDAGLLSVKVDFENKQDALELVSKYYTPNVYMYKDAKFAADKAQVNYQEAEKDFELKVVTAYKKLKETEANYKMLLKSVDRAKESLRLSKLRYQVGVATSIEVLQASEALNSQELYLSQTLQGYNLLKAQFKNMVFVGSGGAGAAAPSGM